MILSYITDVEVIKLRGVSKQFNAAIKIMDSRELRYRGGACFIGRRFKSYDIDLVYSTGDELTIRRFHIKLPDVILNQTYYLEWMARNPCTDLFIKYYKSYTGSPDLYYLCKSAIEGGNIETLKYLVNRLSRDGYVGKNKLFKVATRCNQYKIIEFLRPKVTHWQSIYMCDNLEVIQSFEKRYGRPELGEICDYLLRSGNINIMLQYGISVEVICVFGKNLPRSTNLEFMKRYLTAENVDNFCQTCHSYKYLKIFEYAVKNFKLVPDDDYNNSIIERVPRISYLIDKYKLGF